MKNCVAILAGGVGSRMGGEVPKQFMRLGDGRTVLEASVEAFETHERIDEIVVVSHAKYREEVEAMRKQCGWSKVTQIVDGGEERYLSSVAAVKAFAVRGEDCNLVLHDAARPCVSKRIVDEVCKALQTDEAVAVAIPATDTIYRVAEGQIAEIPVRRTMMLAQTPQAFRLTVIADAYEKAMADGCVDCTDDCGVVMRYRPDVRIALVEGERANTKLTTREDLPAIERELAERKKQNKTK